MNKKRASEPIVTPGEIQSMVRVVRGQRGKSSGASLTRLLVVVGFSRSARPWLKPLALKPHEWG